MLKSNAEGQKVCKKKNLSWLFGTDRKIRPPGSLFGISRQSLVMPNSDPRMDFSIAPQPHERFLFFTMFAKKCHFLDNFSNVIIEPHHEKTCFSHMRTTKVQISLRIHTV